jgi:thiamine-monophosphate kinase
MSSEQRLITLIDGEMPKSPLRKSRSGEVDCEVICLGGKEFLFTTDDFSSEDLLLDADPYILGWNLACGAISDIIAAGGKPLTYAHAMVIPKAWNEEYLKLFSKGISAVLQRYHISFIGGDLGVGEQWRYTATVIGEPIDKIVNRIGCQAGDAIFCTGLIGAGNVQAVLNIYKEHLQLQDFHTGINTKFSTHEKLSALIAEYATSAIDTSDGVLAAVQTLARQNNKGFHIENLQFVPEGIRLSDLVHLPDLLLCMGECGEYEILFTVRQQDIAALTAELTKRDITAQQIGYITDLPEHQSIVYRQVNIGFSDYTLRARDYDSTTDYLKMLIAWAQQRIGKS